jgi:hypothetical protein
MATSMTGPSSWPSGPAEGCFPGNGQAQDPTLPDQGPAEAVGEMADLLQDTRGNMVMDGAVLGAIAIGIALEAAFSARALRPGVAGVVSVGLVCILLLCWLTAVTLLALAGRPVLTALGKLRWRTGAPLDPRPSWTTLPSAGTSRQVWDWTHACLLLGAARLTRYRIQLANTWTCVTAACFLVWTAAVLIGL